MKTVGDRLAPFLIIGVKPGALTPDHAFEDLTELSFSGQWKIIMFYPKDFTFVCPTEIVAYDKLVTDFNDRNAVLLMGSTDNEFCKLAWRNHHDDLRNTSSWMFADLIKNPQEWNENRWVENSLSEQLGILDKQNGVPLRATFIIDPDNVIQHVTVNNLDVGRSPEETLRILDALQTGELCPCNRAVGGATL